MQRQQPTAQVVSSSPAARRRWWCSAATQSSRRDQPAHDVAGQGRRGRDTDGDCYLAWKIYNTAPADVTVDMDDEGDSERAGERLSGVRLVGVSWPRPRSAAKQDVRIRPPYHGACRIEIANDGAVIDGAPVQYVPTAHVGGRIEPTLIILHDTAGGPPWRQRVVAGAQPATGSRRTSSSSRTATSSSWRHSTGAAYHAGASEWRRPAGLQRLVHRHRDRQSGTGTRHAGCCRVHLRPHLHGRRRRAATRARRVRCGCPTPRRSSPPSRPWWRRSAVPIRHRRGRAAITTSSPATRWTRRRSCRGRMRAALGVRAWTPMPAPGLSRPHPRGPAAAGRAAVPVGMADGEVGPRTRMAVRAYQETAGLK